uniref:Ig-like domain-containing protein n=1 Tax=Neogobius melanostomus TaxID=47308 RepID=A0A8C6SSM2_9GOBI
QLFYVIFNVSLKERIEAVSGSCVTIPCSFTVLDDLKNNLNSGCRALWKKETQNKVFTGQTEDVTQKNCTTTLYNINKKQHHGTFFFRLECDNDLKWNFKNASVKIQVTGDVTEGESVSVQCSAPVPCLSLPPTLTWSPVLGDVQETQQQQQNNAFVKVSTLNFTASHSHHEKNITCSAVYSRRDVTSELRLRAQGKTLVKYRPRNLSVTVNPPGAVPEHSNVTLKCSSEAHPPAQLYHWYNSDGLKDTLIGNSSVLNIKASKDTTAVFCEAQNDVGPERSTVTQLDILCTTLHISCFIFIRHISFTLVFAVAPKILNSSNCTGDWSQMSCLCEAEGNPSPLIQWYFPGVSATNISITSEAQSDTSVRSIITVKDAQSKDPVTLLCHSSNSLGSDTQTFTFSTLDKAPEQQGQ